MYIHWCHVDDQITTSAVRQERNRRGKHGPVAGSTGTVRAVRRELSTKVAKKEKKRKDAQLVLRLNKDLRDRFVEACQDLDTSAAREVRRFIKKFLKSYERGEFDE